MRIWKDIYWACVLLFACQLVITPFSASGTLGDVARLVASGLSLLPLYGYAYKVTIGNKAIAVIIFAYNAVFLLVALLFAIHALVTERSLFIMLLVLLLLAVSFTYLYPQYKYAFDSDDLWDASE